MRNLIFSLVAGLVVFGIFFATKLLSAGESILPSVLAITITYFVLARRTFKTVEKIFTEASSGLQTMPPNFAHAISVMERAYPYAPYQFGVRSQIDTQIGVIYFLQQEFSKALPYLEKSLRFGHWLGGAMLGVVYYKKKNNEAMKQTFELVTRKAKKQGLVWNLYAYLLTQIGEQDRAQAVLADGVKHTKGDEKVKESLLALQNGKKIKMKAYKEQWYQFHLERPPAQYQMAPGGARMDRSSFRGRW
jgi:tetratricopeptide (TPR) repeat protein